MAAVLAAVFSVILYLTLPWVTNKRETDAATSFSGSSRSVSDASSDSLDISAPGVTPSSDPATVPTLSSGPAIAGDAASHAPDTSTKTQSRKPAKEDSKANDSHSDRDAIDELFRQATELFDQ